MYETSMERRFDEAMEELYEQKKTKALNALDDVKEMVDKAVGYLADVAEEFTGDPTEDRVNSLIDGLEEVWGGIYHLSKKIKEGK